MLDKQKLKAAMKKSIKAGLERNFSSVSSTSGYAGVSSEQWEKIADAVSDIALDIVDTLQMDAQVMPGIPVTTAGSPSAQAGATTAPGKIS